MSGKILEITLLALALILYASLLATGVSAATAATVIAAALLLLRGYRNA